MMNPIGSAAVLWGPGQTADRSDHLFIKHNT